MMRSCLLLILGLVFGTSGLAEELDFPIPAPRDTRYFRTPARSECEGLLATNELPKGLSQAKVRAAELLLMLIFEHPMLLQAAEEDSVSEKDLFTLFHLSAGFAIRPAPVRNWHYKDVSRYSKDVSKKIRGPSNFRGLRDAEETYVDIQGSFKYAREVGTQSQITNSGYLAGMIFDALIGHTGALSKNINSTQDIRPNLNYQATVIENSRSLKSIYEVRLENFKALTDTQLGHLQIITAQARANAESNTNDRLAKNIRKMFVELAGKHLKDILSIRDEIMKKAAQGSIRSALLEADSKRLEYRKLILRTIVDENGKALSREAQVKRPTYHSLQAAIFDAERLVADDEIDSLDVARSILQKIEGFYDFAAPDKMTKELTWLSWSGLDEHIDELEIEVENLQRAASLRTEVIDKLETGFKDVLSVAQKRLSKYSREIQARGYSEILAQAKLEEAEYLQHAIVQAREVLAEQHPGQIKWLRSLNGLEALIRKHKRDLSMGEKSWDTSRKIEELLNSIRTSQPPSRPGGGRFILL